MAVTARAGALALLFAVLACGLSSREVYQAKGVVQDVDSEARQLLIEHDEIPGFMPAMTMSFDVAPGVSLAGIAAGARVSFDLERSATLLTITAIEISGSGELRAAPRLNPAAALDDAPDFALVDEDGRDFALSRLRGSAVLLDFIFTRCNGPCPILTSAHVGLQRALPPELAARTHFVSVSLDPRYDTPERLRAYAEARGADLERWSFLTGDPEVVQRVLRDYHVGTIRRADGTLDHLVITFLIDPEGRIARRYLGLDHPSAEILADLEQTLG